MQEENKTNIYVQFKNFLKKEGLIYIERFGQYPAVNLKIQSEYGLIYVSIYFIQSKNTLLCKTDFPLRIPSTKRIKIFDYISVINSESLISNFVLDPNNFLSVKTSLYSCEYKIEDETMKRFLFVNINSLNLHFKKIMVLSEINYSPRNVEQNRMSLN